MNDKRLSILIVILLVLQSLTVVVETHAFDQFDAAASAHDALHAACVDDRAQPDTHSHEGQDTPLDHVLHCPHLGCHSPLFVCSGINLPIAANVSLINDSSGSFAPDAPISSLFRPPRA